MKNHISSRGIRTPSASVQCTTANAGISQPAGVTLTEVLMSLMIMSIGVSAVIVLFPISMLRSLQANQLTSGAVVKYNVEELIDVSPGLIFDPDGDGNLFEHFRARAARNYVVDPTGYYAYFADGQTGLANSFGNDGVNPVANIPRFGGGLKTTDGGNEFSSTQHAEALRRFGLAFANQGDGWTTDIDAQAVGPIFAGGNVIGITLSNDQDLSAVGTSTMLGIPLVNDANGINRPIIADPEQFRVLLHSENGKFSQAYPLTNIIQVAGGWQVFWGEDTNGDGTPDVDLNSNGTPDLRPLPREFLVPDLDGDGNPDLFVGRVLLQSRRTNDYSWFLTVRRRGDGAVRNVDVVVKFSGAPDGTGGDERLFEATFAGNSSVVGVRIGADGKEPNIVRGKFIFDAVNARWYRIQSVQEKPLFASGGFWSTYDYQVTVEDPIRVNDGSGNDQNLDGAADGGGSIVFGAAMFMPGVVDVYPMGSRGIPAEFQSAGF